MKYIILIFVLILIGVGLLSQQDLLIHFKARDWEAIQEMLGQELLIILLVIYSFMLMQNVVSFIPFLFLTMFNIWLFGFWYGYLWSLFGNFSGSVAVFYLARYGFQNWAHKYNHMKLKQKFENNGFKAVLIMRLLPVMPASIVNIGSGLSKVKAKDYILATLIGNIVFVFILSLFSAGVIALEHQNTVYAILTVLLLAVVAMKIRKKKKFHATE